VKRLALVFVLLASRFALADEPTVCFVPSETSCTDIVVAQIAAATTSLYIQAYGFTSTPIEQAIVDAYKRGVHVEVILDRSNESSKYSGLKLMKSAHVPTTIDSAHAISHNKVMVINEETVITGSFNFTTSAQKHNAENLIVMHDAIVAKEYLDNWKFHRAHAKPAL
jgi:phospholipase D